MPTQPVSDTRLIACIAIGQTIGWGTLFSVFPLFMAPWEAELGWSRAEVNAGLTCALLVGGLVAVPCGRFVDRHGGRMMLATGAIAGALLLLALSQVRSLPVFWAIWAVMGVVQAAALWTPAMTLVVGRAREPTRAITAISFVTGLSTTIFVPVGALLIEALGWRGALVALAAIQTIPAALTLAMLSPDPARAATAPRAGFSLLQAVRRPAFLALAACFAGHAFVAVGLGAHLIPYLREQGLPEASVLLIVALHGPFQVVARAGLFALGPRATLRGVGRITTALTPVAMLLLAVLPPLLAWLVLFALVWAVADGLMTIIRSAGVMEILGREGYGTLTGALSIATVLPRTLSPLLIALWWEAMGGYGPLPWLLAGIGVLSAAAFSVAAQRGGAVVR
ncbi:MAG: MFS transporter [Acetobacteraceae bacterium]|nr:MFS transporter [Acetobacteraceae bacterium]